MGSAEHLEHVTDIFKSSYAFSVIYPIASMMPKLGLCFMYQRIFMIHPVIHHITYGLIVFLIANGIAWFVPSVIVCIPISDYWSMDPHKRHRCIDSDQFGTWISFPHIISDIVMLVTPILGLRRLRIQGAKKVLVIVAFLSGSM